MTEADLSRAVVAALARYRQPVFVYMPSWDLPARILYDLSRAVGFAVHSGLVQWEGPSYNECRVLVSERFTVPWRNEAVDALVEQGLGRAPQPGISRSRFWA